MAWIQIDSSLINLESICAIFPSKTKGRVDIFYTSDPHDPVPTKGTIEEFKTLIGKKFDS